MYIVNSAFHVKPQHLASFVAKTDSYARHCTRVEAGTIDIRFTQDLCEPDYLYLFEKYEDRSSYEIHCQQPHVTQFVEATRHCITASPIVMVERDEV